MNMKLNCLPEKLTVCKPVNLQDADLSGAFWVLARTHDEISLVCETACVPRYTVAREDGWRALRVEGTLDFSLVGVLRDLTAALAEAGVPVFAVSTFNTDYLLVKEERLQRTADALRKAGCSVE